MKTCWCCPCCHLKAPVNTEHFPVHCACGYVQYCHPAGLGDLAAAALHKIGLTKSRYVNAKAAVGLSRDCDCDKRQQTANKIGKAIGIG